MGRTIRTLAGAAALFVLGACQPAVVQQITAGRPTPAPAPAETRPAPTTTTTTAPPVQPASTGSPRCDAFPAPLAVAHEAGWTVDCSQPGHGTQRGAVLGGSASFGRKEITIWLDVLPSASAVEYMLWHEVGHAIGHDHPDTDLLAYCQMTPAARAGIGWHPDHVASAADCQRLAL